MKNFIRTKLLSFLGVDLEAIDRLMNELGDRIQDQETEISELSGKLDEFDSSLVQREFRNFPHADDIPEESEIIKDVESMIEDTIVEPFEQFQGKNVEKIEQISQNLEYPQINELLENAKGFGAVDNEDYQRLSQVFFEKHKLDGSSV